MTLAAIEHPLTDKQKEVVNYDGDELLIKGIAGSGKTTVLLNKAKKMIKKDPSIRIGLFTYNKTLSQYAKIIAEQIGPRNLFVYTFHGWAAGALRDVTKKRKLFVTNTKDQKDFLKNAVEIVRQDSTHRFVTEEKFREFLAEEISWVKGKGIKNLTEYQDVSRTGRGSSVRVTKPDRKIMYRIFEEYERVKRNSGKIDYDDFALTLLENKEKIRDTYKFDQVMIDEGQDLQQVQLMLLRFIAKKGFAVAADKGQKIYKTSFTWKEIGINILGGRTKILQNSFRSTKQIIQMAYSLQLNDSIIKDEEYVMPILPEYTGPVPDVYQCSTREKQDTAIVSTIKMLLQKNPDKTIGVLSREWKSVNRFYYALQAESIPHEYIKKDQGNAHTAGVKLTTFHSAKGLEFDYVIILDLVDDTGDQELQDEEYKEIERRLLYVSITRAKTYLQLYYYDQPSSLLKEIDSQFYNKNVM
ncbi:ATP-dependent helicase [Bacillus thuringiensis]|uniref:UvrD-helicase domain-containing protein n=1 Tax=Bacillus TaxID=1386 RepID=UPI000BFA7930|nr:MULTISPECIES: ATP-dependent helicase [Bacillus cereus group]KAA0755212.1 ATP-dependent helicase [Bacillus sp. BF2-3]MBV6705109.1 ATP-dependent helicase [Bacillus thuringiensis]MBY0130744.1 ATP-dependent helicase [Bacillus cereus]PFL82514.1 DNA helicase [Bacillus cereus]